MFVPPSTNIPPSPAKVDLAPEFEFEVETEFDAIVLPLTANPATEPGKTMVINLNPPPTNLTESSINKLSVMTSKNVEWGNVEVNSGRTR